MAAKKCQTPDHTSQEVPLPGLYYSCKPIVKFTLLEEPTSPVYLMLFKLRNKKVFKRNFVNSWHNSCVGRCEFCFLRVTTKSHASGAFSGGVYGKIDSRIKPGFHSCILLVADDIFVYKNVQTRFVAPQNPSIDTCLVG